MYESIEPTPDELMALFQEKNSTDRGLGWGPKLRLRHNYFTPDEYYEALTKNLVITGCSWIDIGCGRDIFPNNKMLAEALGSRAEFVQGVDPDPNVHENPYIGLHGSHSPLG